jgi:hypothetical protein
VPSTNRAQARPPIAIATTITTTIAIIITIADGSAKPVGMRLQIVVSMICLQIIVGMICLQIIAAAATAAA